MSDFRIANGHNNAAGMLRLSQISPPLFEYFDDDVRTEWHSAESRVLTGDRRYRNIGRPYVIVTLEYVTRQEAEYLVDTFGQQVTIQTLDKEANEHRTYNALMALAEWGEQLTDRLAHFESFPIRFYDLVRLP